MGGNMFGGHPGPWNTKEPWNGWWGVNPPFHHPVFVVTHHAREPLRLEGGTTFIFVSGGIQSALEQVAARRRGQGRVARRRSERGTTVSGGGRGGRDGDQPRPDAARERGAAVRGARRRPARARSRADRRRSQGDASQVREAVSAPTRTLLGSVTGWSRTASRRWRLSRGSGRAEPCIFGGEGVGERPEERGAVTAPRASVHARQRRRFGRREPSQQGSRMRGMRIVVEPVAECLALLEDLRRGDQRPRAVAGLR